MYYFFTALFPVHANLFVLNEKFFFEMLLRFSQLFNAMIAVAIMRLIFTPFIFAIT